MQVDRSGGNETQARTSGVGLLRIAEVAAMLGTSDSQVRNMVARGQLVKPLKVPGLGLRWRVEAVRAWLENLERGATT
jgi:excisionase family DNA binding protein